MAIGYGIAAPKPLKMIRQVKDRAKRVEGKVKKFVRFECVARDGYCRLGSIEALYHGCADNDDALTDVDLRCVGPSEWAHMHSRRRSQTRNQAPEIRHDTQHSFMACQRHHDQYDGRQRPQMFVTSLTRKGADGPLKFRMEAAE